MSNFRTTLHSEDGAEIIPPDCAKCGRRCGTFVMGQHAHAWLCGYCDLGYSESKPAEFVTHPCPEGHYRSEFGCDPGWKVNFPMSDGSVYTVDGNRPGTFLVSEHLLKDNWIIKKDEFPDG